MLSKRALALSHISIDEGDSLNVYLTVSDSKDII